MAIARLPGFPRFDEAVPRQGRHTAAPLKAPDPALLPAFFISFFNVIHYVRQFRGRLGGFASEAATGRK
ncbi:hypothetical protein ACE0DR_16595 [Azotobacter sp. CWF10]